MLSTLSLWLYPELVFAIVLLTSPLVSGRVWERGITQTEQIHNLSVFHKVCVCVHLLGEQVI